MSFDYIYHEEWSEAGITPNEVDEARTLLQAIFTTNFLDTEAKRSDNLGADPLTKMHGKHPVLIYLESPFLSNVCNLLHLARAFSTFKDSASVSEYISRMKKVELFKASLLELEFATYLHEKGFSPKPSHKVPEGEIDIFLPEEALGQTIFFECKSYEFKRSPEEARRSLVGSIMKYMKDLPTGFIIGFKSYVEINEDNLKPIKNKLKRLITDAQNLLLRGESVHDLFFGRLVIIWVDNISEALIQRIRAEYNEVVVRAMVSHDSLKHNFEVMKNHGSADMQEKERESVLAMDLPLNHRPAVRRDYFERAKTDIEAKIKQHRDRLAKQEQVCIILEDIPPEDFLRLKNEVETGLYGKYLSLSILFVKKAKNKKNITYEVLPMKLTPYSEKLLSSLV